MSPNTRKRIGGNYASSQLLVGVPNKEIMQKIISHRGEGATTSYHASNNLKEREIADLSRVIENSLVASMSKGKHSHRMSHRASGGDDHHHHHDKKKDNIAQVRYGITEIDTNYELKKFITQQSEKRINVKNKLLHNIKQFMDDIVKVHDGKAAPKQGHAHLAKAELRSTKIKPKKVKSKFDRQIPIEQNQSWLKQNISQKKIQVFMT